ncbi:MAG: hypothetical protein CMM01_24265 [Rhodopirellula sp.]|nr:hypothetical protein [Rhodopirellula sp.]
MREDKLDNAQQSYSRFLAVYAAFYFCFGLVALVAGSFVFCIGCLTVMDGGYTMLAPMPNGESEEVVNSGLMFELMTQIIGGGIAMIFGVLCQLVASVQTRNH